VTLYPIKEKTEKRLVAKLTDEEQRQFETILNRHAAAVEAMSELKKIFVRDRDALWAAIQNKYKLTNKNLEWAQDEAAIYEHPDDPENPMGTWD